MIALIQRVSRAQVEIKDSVVGRIDTGILALIGITPEDNRDNVVRMTERLLTYRIFEDADGRMNRSVYDIEGGLLLVPQFTLAADTRKGTRASFSGAAPPQQAESLFLELLKHARSRYTRVQSGRFGADMSVTLTNRGPVTFWLQA